MRYGRRLAPVVSAARDALLLLRAAIRTALLRARRGRLRPSWSFALEVLLAALRKEMGRTDWPRRRAPPRGPGIDAARVRVEWMGDPTAGRTVLVLHGGGFTGGSIASHRQFIQRVGDECEARVLAVDYRLAPEHPFPAAVEDAVAAYRWLVDAGVDPGRVAVVGESAGGGLALSLLVAARDRGLPLPAAAVCISPWCDLSLSGGSVSENREFDWQDADGLRARAAAYLAGADPRSPLASPVFAPLGGLPPILIQTGALELLRDDGVRLAQALREAGGLVTLEVWSEMFHAWHLFPRLRRPEADRAFARVAAFVREATATPDRAAATRAEPVAPERS